MSSTNFGLCVTTAILLSGCSTLGTQQQPMAFYDLDYFVVDCKIKSQQIAWLQTMRPSTEQKIQASLSNKLRIFPTSGTDTEKTVANGRYNWLINQHLMKLAECPNI